MNSRFFKRRKEEKMWDYDYNKGCDFGLAGLWETFEKLEAYRSGGLASPSDD